VRKGTVDDIETIVEIHSKAMPESLLVRLGPDFLKKRIFSFALDSPDVVVFVLEKKKTTIGFSIYSKKPKIFSDELSKYKIEIFITILNNIMSDPWLLKDCVSSYAKVQTIWTKQPPEQLFYLFLIAIEPDKQRTGSGTFFLSCSLNDASKYFQAKHCLVDTRNSNSYNFYKNNGFIEIGHEKRGSKKFYKLLKNLKLIS
jgi:hypothetical protein